MTVDPLDWPDAADVSRPLAAEEVDGVWYPYTLLDAGTGDTPAPVGVENPLPVAIIEVWAELLGQALADKLVEVGYVQGLVEGVGVSVDNTDPLHPVVSIDLTGVVQSVQEGGGILVDVTDPSNPVVAADFGTGTGKITEGNDARLSDARTPTDGSVTPAKFNASAVDPVAGTAGARTLGTGGQQAAAGDDSRFSDARTPTDASVTPAKFAASAIDPVAGTAGARTLGTGGQQAAAGNDSRLSDSRTPAAGSVVDASVSASAAIAESKLALASDAVAGTASRRTLGTGGQQAAAGNDSRLSDTRTPTDASVTPAKFASSAIDPVAATAGARTLGTGAQQALPGNATPSTIGAAPKTPTVGTSLGTSGTVDLDLAALDGTIQRISASGNITFTTSNRAAGRGVRIFIDAGGSSRTLAYPAWVAHGNALPASLASGKRLALTVLSLGTTDGDISAVASAQP